MDLDKLTVEELCKVFEEDGVKVSKAMVTKAKKGQSTAMVSIAGKYAPKHIYDKAFEWHLLAANNNNIDAFLQVGNHYFRGEGVEKNYLNAMEWYLKYIDLSRNTKTAVLSNIVDMFAKGLGVPANEVKAHEWNQINENQTFSFMVGGVAGLPKEKKDLDMLITESQEIVRVAKGGNGSKELLGESEPITIDSPSPSSSGLQEQLQQYNQRQIQQMPLQPFYHQLKLPPSQPQQQPQQQLQHQPQHQTQYQPPVEPKRRNTSRSQEDFLGDVPPTIYTSNVARDLNIKKIQYLEDTNFHLIELLKQEKHEKNEFYNTLKSRIVALEDENRDMKKKMEETQLSNQNLTVLLEQERRIRKNDMELADQERKKIMKRS